MNTISISLTVAEADAFLFVLSRRSFRTPEGELGYKEEILSNEEASVFRLARSVLLPVIEEFQDLRGLMVAQKEGEHPELKELRAMLNREGHIEDSDFMKKRQEAMNRLHVLTEQIESEVANDEGLRGKYSTEVHPVSLNEKAVHLFTKHIEVMEFLPTSPLLDLKDSILSKLEQND